MPVARRRRAGHLLAAALVCAVAPAPAAAGALVINEILAANDTTLADADGDRSDWIELYNDGATAIDLEGYTLTDDPQHPARWRFPALAIDPGALLLVWASGKNRVTGGELHTSFKLDRHGEFAALYAPGGTLVDSLTFGEQATDIAWGRLPDGAGTWARLAPTPGAANRAPPATVTLGVAPPQGRYAAAVTVELSAEPPGGAIRYTLDGSDPAPSSALYTAPLVLDATRLVRARVFDAGDAGAPRSEVADRLYLIDDPHDLPILSLATDPAGLWDPDTGIMVHYDERGPAWERPAHASLIEGDHTTVFATGAGIRIHGGWNRRLEKKSLRLYFRSEYGTARLAVPLFDDGVASFDRLLLHSGSEDHPLGFDTWTLVRESLTANLANRLPGGSLLTPAYRPLALYLNGAYWGIYWLRERLDGDFVEQRLGLDAVDLLEDGPFPELRAGDADYWLEAMDALATYDVRDDSVYAGVQQHYIDTDNFADYEILEIYAANWDWPHHNNFRYHDRSGPHPWRWVIWDVDNAWASELPIDHDTLAWATRDRLRNDLAYGGADDPELLWSTELPRTLLANDDFRRGFINRFADLLNTTLAAASVAAQIDSLASLIAPEVPREIERWADWWTPADWQANLELLRDFAAQRPELLRGYLREQFGLGANARLTLEVAAGEGAITVNSITPAPLPWSGIYFTGVPVTVTAAPAAGYAFAGWSDAELPAAPAITLTLAADRTLAVRFEATGVGVAPEAGPGAPPGPRLYQNVPNPFNPRTAIVFELPAAMATSTVELAIYDVRGERVRTLVRAGHAAAGRQRVEWDGRADGGARLASGVYWYRLQADGLVAARRMLLLR